MALDQGTSSSRCIIYNQNAQPVAMAQQELTQIFPQPGWVEHNPTEIWQTQLDVAKKAMQQLQITADQIAGIGITNQRETTVIWDRKTGNPIHNAIVWQDRRTASVCDQLKAGGLEMLITSKTGLLPDAYFSATKISWLLDNVPGAREKANRGDLAFGTIDTWLASDPKTWKPPPWVPPISRVSPVDYGRLNHFNSTGKLIGNLNLRCLLMKLQS
jgi:glycerol kinase